MTKSLYTIVLDFRGGTYIGQATQESPKEAVIAWTAGISQEDANEWRLDKEQLQSISRIDEATAVDGCTGVWCLSGTIDGHMALIHVVQTSGPK